MASKSKEYYELFKEDLSNAVQWFESNSLQEADLYDVCIFRISHRIGEIKDEEVARIKADKKLKITLVDYCVEFAKITSRYGVEQTKTYSYSMPYQSAPLIHNGRPLFNQEGTECRYMPAYYLIAADEVYNKSDEAIILSREGAGKYVCDRVDTATPPTVKSYNWTPGINYTTYTTMPEVALIEKLPMCVVNSLSLLALVGKGAYVVNSKAEADKFNGIIVTPVVIIYNQILDALVIANKGQ